MDSSIFSIDKQSPDFPYVVMLPGWGHDWRTMSLCKVNANRIYVHGNLSPALLPRLANFLKRSRLSPVSIIGWSLGGFAAVDFADLYPDLVESLILVGIRRRYNPEEIQASREELLRDKKAFLEGFYKRNFLPAQKRDWEAFKSELMPAYIEQMDINDLMQGLDYLAASSIDEQSLAMHSTVIVHGRRDLIAPVDDICNLAEGAGVPIHVFNDASHAAFLHRDFSGVVDQWLKQI